MAHFRSAIAGTSLPEVVAALGLLAGVLLSSAGLLALAGQRIVQGGRSSVALALAGDVAERMARWSFSELHSAFDCDPAAIVCNVDPDHAVLREWTDSSSLHRARLSISVESLDSGALAVCTAVRITLTLRWQDGPRRRQLQLVRLRG